MNSGLYILYIDCLMCINATIILFVLDNTLFKILLLNLKT